MEILELLKDLFVRFVVKGTVTSADDWFGVIREAGIRIARSAIREAWREFNENTGYARVIANLPEERRPYPLWAVPTEEEMFDKYTLKYRLTFRDIETEALINTNFFVTDDKLLTRGEYDRRLLDEADAYASRYNYELVGIEIRGFYRRE